MRSSRPSYRQQQQKAAHAVANKGAESVVVTMPVHPFYQQKLGVVRFERDKDGKRFVYVHHPKVGFLRLPIEWTDRSIPIPSFENRNRDLKINVTGLINLARACAVALSEKVDDNERAMNSMRQSNGRNHSTNGFASRSLGESFKNTETNIARNMGVAHAQNDSNEGQGDVP
jgi:hypothetical protein